MTLPRLTPQSPLRRGGKVVALIASLSIVALTALAAGVDSLVGRIDSGTSVSVSEDSQTNLDIATDTPTPLNILIMGSDTRDGQGEGFGSLAAYGGSARSDTTVLVHISADRSRALLVSVPRDSYVEIPACTTADGGQSQPTTDRFNVAFALGGPECTIKTLESLTGIKVDHWATVDFNGFINVVDALGGVEVCLDRAVKDRKSKLDLPAGRTNVDGKQALAFVRARFNIGDGGDLSRMKRQQAFMASIVRKASSSQLLLNPIALVKVIDATTKSLSTDSGLASSERIRDIALDLSGIEPAEVRFVTVPSRLRDGGATVEWTTRARRLWQAVRNDKPWPPSSAEEVMETEQTITTTTDETLIDPGEIKVRVLNGAGVSGVARRTAEAIEALGYQIAGVGDAEKRLTATQIEHGPRRIAEAKSLSAKFGQVQLIERPGLGEALVLTIGADQPQINSKGTANKKNTTATSPEEDPDSVGVSDATEVFCAS